MENVSDKKQLRLADAITRLENLILGMEKELLKDVKIIDSGTKCSLATEKLEFTYPNFEIETSCTRKRPICSLPEYLQRNAIRLKALHDGISSNSELQRLHKVLGEVLQDPKKAKGRNCQGLGDTIICLDAPRRCDILSTNIKDFAPICDFLSKSFVGIRW